MSAKHLLRIHYMTNIHLILIAIFICADEHDDDDHSWVKPFPLKFLSSERNEGNKITGASWEFSPTADELYEQILAAELYDQIPLHC